MPAAQRPFTVLYDGACPVCSLEMDHLKARDAAGCLALVDIAQPGFDAAPYGATLAELNAQIHGLHPDGRLLRGMDVLRLSYAVVGLGGVLRFTAWAPLRPVFDAAYRLFARHRATVSTVLAPWVGRVRRRRAASAAFEEDAAATTQLGRE